MGGVPAQMIELVDQARISSLPENCRYRGQRTATLCAPASQLLIALVRGDRPRTSLAMRIGGLERGLRQVLLAASARRSSIR